MSGCIEYGRLGGLFVPHVWNHVLNSKPALLLHFDGEDEAEETTDSGATGHTINFNGGAILNTGTKKFGASSLAVNGSTGYLDIDDHADWDINGTNVTIDLWVRHGDHVGTETYIAQVEDITNLWRFTHVDGSGIHFVVKKSDIDIVDTGYGGEITDTNWHHLAMCKVGNEYGIYKDGVQVGHVSDSDTDTFAGSLYVGSSGTVFYFYGNIDELRISKYNCFNAAPVEGLTDTITVPDLPYVSWS